MAKRRDDSDKRRDVLLAGIALALGSSVFYGMNTPIAKLAYLEGSLPEENVLLRVVAALSAMLLYFASRVVAPGRRDPADIRKRGARGLKKRFEVSASQGGSQGGSKGGSKGDSRLASRAIAMVSLGIVSATLSLAYLGSVVYIPAGAAALAFYTFPPAILLVAPLIEGRRPSIGQVIFILSAFGGIAVFSLEGLDAADDRDAYEIGLGLALLASSAAAAQAFLLRRLALLNVAPASVLGGGHAVGLVCILAYMFWKDGGAGFRAMAFYHPDLWTLLGVLAAVYLGAILCQVACLRRISASVAAPFFNIEPIATLAVASALLDERFLPSQYFGALIVVLALGGSALIALKRAKV